MLATINVGRGDIGDATWNLSGVIPFGSGFSKVTHLAEDAGVGFKSFTAFKRAMGAAGPGREWHHIVTQLDSNVERFGEEAIHNTRNLVSIPKDLHAKVTGHYNSLMRGSKTLVRDHVKTLSFEEQYQYGVDVLKRFGWTP